MHHYSTPEIEKHLQDTIFPELEEGRPGWDKPHTEAVVYYLKKIIHHAPHLKPDFVVLLIAAYAHDWGYARLFHKGKEIKLHDIIAMKQLHMEIGAEKITALLENPFFSFLTPEQKLRTIHLVAVHDKLKQLTETDELILMEADTLGGLDTDFIKPFADKESSDKYIRGVEVKRQPLFITSWGKEKLVELMEKRKKYYEINLHTIE